MNAPRNIAACLVHDNFECLVDLIQNVHYFSPDSLILLYNGGNDTTLFPSDFPYDRYNAVIHPASRPMNWGRLHDFAFDCIEFAVENYDFTSLTIVDSDQLLSCGGYTEFVANYFQQHPDVGLLGSSNTRIVQTEQFGPARSALEEIDLWRPLLDKFENGLEQFVYWTFWPATTFSYAAARDINARFRKDALLRTILQKTQIIATEEVVFPTLTALLGYRVETVAALRRYVRFRVNVTPENLADTDGMLNRSYWLHPVPRRYDDPTRLHLRARHHSYNLYPPTASCTRSATPLQGNLLGDGALIVARQRPVEGWLEDDEAALLIAMVERAAAQRSPEEGLTIVEVGSYCGKSTIVLALAAKAQELPGRVYAIDRFDGRIGAHDGTITQGPPTHQSFLQNIARAGLESIVEPIRNMTHRVAWDRPIDVLLVDGYHDYPNVARDFYHFAPHLRPDALVAFHDYAVYYPGVRSFVDELLASGDYLLAGRAGTLVILERAPVVQPWDVDVLEPAPEAAYPEAAPAASLVQA